MNVSDTNYCIWVYEEAPYTEDHFYPENCAPREQKFDFGLMKYFVCLKGKQFLHNVNFKGICSICEPLGRF